MCLAAYLTTLTHSVCFFRQSRERVETAVMLGELALARVPGLVTGTPPEHKFAAAEIGWLFSLQCTVGLIH